MCRRCLPAWLLTTRPRLPVCLPRAALSRPSGSSAEGEEKVKVVVVPVPVPVFIPVPMNLYSQHTPVPVAMPVPVCFSSHGSLLGHNNELV